MEHQARTNYQHLRRSKELGGRAMKREDRSISSHQRMELQAVLWWMDAIMEVIGTVLPGRDPVGVTKVLETNSATHCHLQVLLLHLCPQDHHKISIATTAWERRQVEAASDQIEAEEDINHVVAAVMVHLEEDILGQEAHLRKATWDEVVILVKGVADSTREVVVAIQWPQWRQELLWEWLGVLWPEDNKEGRRQLTLPLVNTDQQKATLHHQMSTMKRLSQRRTLHMDQTNRHRGITPQAWDSEIRLLIAQDNNHPLQDTGIHRLLHLCQWELEDFHHLVKQSKWMPQ